MTRQEAIDESVRMTYMIWGECSAIEFLQKATTTNQYSIVWWARRFYNDLIVRGIVI